MPAAYPEPGRLTRRAPPGYGRRMLRPLLLAAPALALLGCNDACERRCMPLEDFYEACAAELDEAGVVLQCYDDEVSAFDDGSLDPAYARACTDGQDLVDSCLSASRARAAALDPEENAERLEACEQKDPWIRAVRKRDCAGAIEAALEYRE